MKKLFAIVLALTLVMSMSATAFAAESGKTETVETDATSAAQDITARSSDEGSKVAVISVDVIFGDMAFSYISDSVSRWNPETHKYESEGTSQWVADGDNSIKIVNHSNRDIELFINSTMEDAYDGSISVLCNDTNLSEDTVLKTLKSAEINTSNEESVDVDDLCDSVTVYVTLDGGSVSSTDYVTIAEITVTISDLGTDSTNTENTED